ncbi:MAG TPA: hypothetical protein VKS21_06645 [Spirochaetota bacterium]|nr:hypothetical protein [Spirochaetota bacterium]
MKQLNLNLKKASLGKKIIFFLKRKYFSGETDQQNSLRRFFASAACLVSIVVLIYYARLDYLTRNMPHFILNTAFIPFLVLLLLLTNLQKKPWIVYNIFIGALGALLIYYSGWDDPRHGTLLWFFIFPLISFFLCGRKNGLLWMFATYGFLFTMLLFPGLLNTGYYPVRFKTTFIISLLTVSFFSFLSIFLVENFNRKLKDKQKKLEEALASIKTLKGLVPICSYCHSIRDDKGYWKKIENYLHEHTDAFLSHGICDDCLKKHYPDTYTKLKNK